jgi:hypothetical protein
MESPAEQPEDLDAICPPDGDEALPAYLQRALDELVATSHEVRQRGIEVLASGAPLAGLFARTGEVNILLDLLSLELRAQMASQRSSLAERADPVRLDPSGGIVHATTACHAISEWNAPCCMPDTTSSATTGERTEPPW